MGWGLAGPRLRGGLGASVPGPYLRIRGARTHNLQGVDLDLPLRGLTAFIGPSGSGKSSLARDTIHAASRRSIAAVIGEARAEEQAARALAGAQVDLIEGLPLCLYLGPEPVRGEICLADLLDLAAPLAALGLALVTVHCPECGRPLPVHSPTRIVEALCSLPPESKLVLMAPLARKRSQGLAGVLAEVVRQGFSRVRLDGSTHALEDLPQIDARLPHDLDLVVDRMRPGPEQRERLEEAVSTALAAGGGTLLAEQTDPSGEVVERSWSDRPWCPQHPSIPQRRLRASDLLPSAGARSQATLFWSHPELSWVRLLGSPLRDVVEQVERASPPGRLAGAQALLLRRAALAIELGLGDLPLHRLARDLSSGELARARLARSGALELPGSLLVLDDVLAHLDPVSAQRVRGCLERWAEQGRAVLVLDHDPVLARQSSRLFAFGPGSGRGGGALVWEGRGADLPAGLLDPVPDAAALPSPPELGLRLSGPALQALGLDPLFLPPGRLGVLRGPSGAGKSRLLHQLLAPALRARLSGDGLLPPGLLSLDGLTGEEQLLQVEAGNATTNPHAIVATSLGAWSPLRELLAATRQARMAGLDASSFRLDRAGGRCPECEGSGLVQGGRQERLDAEGLAEGTDEACPACDGRRFTPELLRVRIKGGSLPELLDFDLQSCAALFSAHRVLGPILAAAESVGLGHLPLGQSSRSLSGGERQRLRLARELARGGANRSQALLGRVFLLDAPTAGLHPIEATRVAKVLQQMAQRGATVLASTHDPTLMSLADYALDIGAQAP